MYPMGTKGPRYSKGTWKSKGAWNMDEFRVILLIKSSKDIFSMNFEYLTLPCKTEWAVCCKDSKPVNGGVQP